MPACIWHPELEMEFALEMRRLLDENGFEALKIWLMDHNLIMWRRAAFQMSDPEIKKACAGIAWHPYEGHPEMLSWFRREHPECENHWTEGSILPIDLRNAVGLDTATNMGRLAEGFLQCISHGIQSITVWNLALDDEGYPNIGPFDCRGTFTISQSGHSAVPSSEYHTLLHFTKYIKRGAKRIILQKDALPRNFAVEGFENPDGQTVLVVSNTEAADSEFNLRVNGRCFTLPMLRKSVSTVLI
jgi:glucosylceramidase